MKKRPLCLVILFFLFLQFIRVEILQCTKDQVVQMQGTMGNKINSGEVTSQAKSSEVTLTGIVTKQEQKKDYQILYLKNQQVIVYLKKDNINQKQDDVKLSNIKSQNTEYIFKIGNEIQVKGELEFFDVPTNPGMFDQKFYYAKQGIHGCIWAEEIKKTSSKTLPLQEMLSQLKFHWKEQLIQVMGEKKGGILSAVLLGDKSELEPDLQELYRLSGIGHILAISGLHMSFLGVGLYGLLRRRGISFLTAGSIGILFLCLYTMMIGWGVSSMRALVMFIVRMGADISGRVYDGPTSLSLAALVIVGLQPMYLLDAGFLLSFGAVLGMQLVYPVLEAVWLPPRPKLLMVGEKLPPSYKIKRTLLKSLLASLSIHMMILPIMLYFYFEFPPYSMLLNLLVIPLMSWVLGAGIFGSAFLLAIPFVGEMLLKSCGIVLNWYEILCTQSFRLPFHRVVTGQPEKWKLFVYYTVLFGGLLFWNKRKQRQREEDKRASVKLQRTEQGVVVLTLLLLLLISRPKSGLEVTMLDIGQGDCIFLRTKNVTCLIDGGSSDVGSVGKYRIEPFLKSQGVAVLDLVFISHGDADHMNGIEEMLERQEQGVRIRGLVLPPKSVWDEKLKTLAQLAQEHESKVYTMQQGEMLEMGSLSLECIQPEAESTLTPGNEASMVLSVAYEAFSMLCTGDAEGTGEAQMIQNLPKKNYTVLKVAHHGSKNSTKDTFLKVCSAPYALISAGRDNRYGHPHEETIQRLQADGSHVITTQEAGAIMLWTDGEKLHIQEK